MESKRILKPFFVVVVVVVSLVQFARTTRSGWVHPMALRSDAKSTGLVVPPSSQCCFDVFVYLISYRCSRTIVRLQVHLSPVQVATMSQTYTPAINEKRQTQLQWVEIAERHGASAILLFQAVNQALPGLLMNGKTAGWFVNVAHLPPHPTRPLVRVCVRVQVRWTST